MVVVPLSKAANEPGLAPRAEGADSTSWMRIAAAGTLAASGALLLAGKRRAGLLTAVSGAVLAMLDQQEVVRAWFSAVPAYLEEAQELLDRAQTVVENLSVQGEKLRRVLGK